jgi:hypothetical protein
MIIVLYRQLRVLWTPSTILSFRNHFTVSLPNDFIRHNHFYQRITPPENEGVEALLNRPLTGTKFTFYIKLLF